MTRYDEPSPLDPLEQPDRWERLVGSIMSEAAPELARLAEDRPTLPLVLLTEWARPVLAAAASLIALAGAALVALDGGAGTGDAVRPPLVADAIAPEPVASWLVTGESPSVEELLEALQGGGS